MTLEQHLFNKKISIQQGCGSFISYILRRAVKCGTRKSGQLRLCPSCRTALALINNEIKMVQRMKGLILAELGKINNTVYSNKQLYTNFKEIKKAVTDL